MPKIIENLESKLIEEARAQLAQSGYAAVTIRSVAKAVGVGVGTVYNYFPSKDALFASFMIADWRECVRSIEALSACSDSPAPVVRCIWEQLRLFTQRHRGIIRDEAASAGFSGSFSRYHGLLRSQLAKPLRKFCGSDFASEFIAEALLTWTMAEKTFEEIYGMIEKLFDMPC